MEFLILENNKSRVSGRIQARLHRLRVAINTEKDRKGPKKTERNQKDTGKNEKTLKRTEKIPKGTILIPKTMHAQVIPERRLYRFISK